MKKKLLLSLLLSFPLSTLFAQTTYYLQDVGGGATPVDMTDILNWNSAQDGSGGNPTLFAFTDSTTHIWDINGTVNVDLSGGDLTLAGQLENSGAAAIIDVIGNDLTLQGVVEATRLSITDGFPIPAVSNSIVDYAAVTLQTKDIIPGTYTNLHISGNNIFGAAGDITVNKEISTSGSTTIGLNMNTNNLIDGGSFNIDSLGSGLFTISTQSTASIPVPADIIWPDGVQVRYNSNSGTDQYIQSGSYHELYIASTGDKVILADDTVRVRSTFFNNTNLVLEAASASSYAQLTSDISMTGGGTIEQQVYLDLGAASGRYFHLGSGLISSPYNSIVESGATMVAANDATGSIWLWTGTSADWTAPAGTGINTTPGIGVAVYVGAGTGGPYVRSGSGAISWEGTDVHTADINDNLYYFNPPGNDTNFVDPMNDDGWNLRANPFTANYDFENQTIPAGMYNSYSVWDGTQYEVYQVGGAGTASRHIAPGQAIWLRSTGAAVSFAFEKANERMSGSSTLKSAGAAIDMLSLHVEEVNGSYSDDAFIRLYSQASDADEALYDAAKMFNPGDVPNLYVKLNSGSYAICGANVSRSTFPLYFMDANDGQQMEISIGKNTLASYGTVFLEDKKTSAFTNLTSTGKYTFTNDKSFGADRFVIHLESGVGLPEGMVESANYDVYYGNDALNFVFQSNDFKPTSGSLYSLQGKLIYSFEIEEPNASVQLPSVATGIYLISIEGDVSGARKVYIK